MELNQEKLYKFIEEYGINKSENTVVIYSSSIKIFNKHDEVIAKWDLEDNTIQSY